MGRMGVSSGGMQTLGRQHTIICPLCNKPAFSATLGIKEMYRHFTKNGVMEHIKDVNGSWSRKRL